jgi:hypothetical protein
MVMGEEISRLMDGELDDEHLDVVCQLKRPRLGCWACYHVIGDTLRGNTQLAPGFAAFRARLPPSRRCSPQRGPQPPLSVSGRRGHVAAVSVVGWAFGILDAQPTHAKAREGRGARRAVKPGRTADYLLAHQEPADDADRASVPAASGAATAGGARP